MWSIIKITPAKSGTWYGKEKFSRDPRSGSLGNSTPDTPPNALTDQRKINPPSFRRDI